MHTVELYRKVRLACRDGMSERAAARHFGISRESVKKMLCFSVPPGYRRTVPVRRPKLDGFIEIIDQWLKEDLKQLRKQRHTAKRIFDRLRAEHGFSGGYTIVKDYVREHHRRRREMFVPLTHPPGHGQADFGEARAVIGGVARKAHFFVFDLPHSDACYVRAYSVKLNRQSISRRTVEALTVEKDTVFWDRDLPGFGVRVYASGTKMYVVQSRAGGKSVRVTVGRHGVISADEARRRAARIVNRIKAGEDPVAEPLPARLAGGPMVADLAARYMEEHVAVRCKRSTAEGIQGLLDKYIVPEFGRLPLLAVERERVVAFPTRRRRW